MQVAFYNKLFKKKMKNKREMFSHIKQIKQEH